MKALGIDFGKARIGLALSDDLGMLAHPLETVPGKNPEDAVQRISEIVNEKKVETVVVGLPLHLNGEEGTAVESVRKFAELLLPHLPESVDLVEVDERLTTVSAMEKLHEAGRTEKNSRPIIDQAAAVEILQEWLDRQAGPDVLPDPWDEDESKEDYDD